MSNLETSIRDYLAANGGGVDSIDFEALTKHVDAQGHKIGEETVRRIVGEMLGDQPEPEAATDDDGE